MVLFRGWRMALELDEVLMPEEVFSAHDEEGRRYLFAHTSAVDLVVRPHQRAGPFVRRLGPGGAAGGLRPQRHRDGGTADRLGLDGVRRSR